MIISDYIVWSSVSTKHPLSTVRTFGHKSVSPTEQSANGILWTKQTHLGSSAALLINVTCENISACVSTWEHLKTLPERQVSEWMSRLLTAHQHNWATECHSRCFTPGKYSREDKNECLCTPMRNLYRQPRTVCKTIPIIRACAKYQK